MLTAILLCAGGVATAQEPVSQQAASAQEEVGLPQLRASDFASPTSGSGLYPWLDHGPGRTPSLSWSERRGDGVTAMMWSRLREHAWSKPEEIAAGDNWFVNWADHPVHVASSSGSAMACWLQKVDAAPYAYHVQTRRRHAEGWGAIERLHQDATPTEHGFVSLELLPQSGYAAIWLDGGGGPPMTLRGRWIPFAGEAGPEALLDDQVCDCCSTALRRSANGRLLATYRDRAEHEVRDIRFLRLNGLDAAAKLLDSPPRFEVAQQGEIHADGWKMPACPVNGPAMATTPTVFAAAWFTLGKEERARVRLSVWPQAGTGGTTAFSSPRTLASGPQVLGRVAVCADSTGRLLVCWLEDRDGVGHWVGQLWLPLAGQLRPMSAPTSITEVSASRAAGFLRLAPAPQSGGWIAAWTEPDPERPRDGHLRLARIQPARPTADKAADGAEGGHRD